MTTKIDPELLQIYAGSDYRVDVPGGDSFVMHIHEPCPALFRLMADKAVGTAAFISAFNPGSEPRTDEENARAQSRLRQEVDSAGWPCYEGIGEDPGGQCAGEPCLLVLGISREDAFGLGQRYGQNAVVWAEADAVPQLMLTR